MDPRGVVAQRMYIDCTVTRAEKETHVIICQDKEARINQDRHRIASGKLAMTSSNSLRTTRLIPQFIPSSHGRHSKYPFPHTVRTTRSSASAKYRRFLLFSPAIEIRPFAVRYTCASSTNAFDCAVEIPVKLHQTATNEQYQRK